MLLGFRWFEAMEQKPSYLGTKSDFYTHVHDLPPQLGGESGLSDCSQRNRTRRIHADDVTGPLSLVLNVVSEPMCSFKGSKLLPTFAAWQCTCESLKMVRWQELHQRCHLYMVVCTMHKPCTHLLESVHQYM